MSLRKVGAAWKRSKGDKKFLSISIDLDHPGAQYPGAVANQDGKLSLLMFVNDRKGDNPKAPDYTLLQTFDDAPAGERAPGTGRTQDVPPPASAAATESKDDDYPFS